MKKILIATSALVIFAGVGLFWVYTGFVDVRATTPHSGLTKSVLSAAMHASVKRNAKGIEVPSLEAEELILEGINDFEAMCVDCHGAPGKDLELRYGSFPVNHQGNHQDHIHTLRQG